MHESKEEIPLRLQETRMKLTKARVVDHITEQLEFEKNESVKVD
jgi:hypothetical protein